ncbi:MAG: phage portal protein, partial [Alphaproteobacteria bacterium]
MAGWLTQWVRALGGTSARAGSGTGVAAAILGGARPAAPSRDAQTMTAAYAEAPWLRAVVARIASGLAAVPWQAWQRHEDGSCTRLLDHPMLTLLERGSALMTGVALRRVTAQHLELTGEAYWLKDRDQAGEPVALHPLPPAWVLAIPLSAGDSYRIALPGGRQVLVPASEIVAFRDPDPRHPYGRGLGAATALADEIALDEATARFLAAFFENHARPDMIVTGTRDAPLSEEGAKRLAAVWEGRHRGAAQ